MSNALLNSVSERIFKLAEPKDYEELKEKKAIRDAAKCTFTP
jgi:hypothetical protein